MSDKLDLVIQRIDDLKDNTNSRLDSIDRNLGEHMKRTDMLEKLHIENSSRIAKLENPDSKIAKKYLKNKITVSGALAGAVLVILKLITTIKL